MAVTLRDVAAKAGVSPVVVSRVLHNRALNVGVSEATAQRVRDAAKELGYRRNVAAISFRTQQTMSIGLFHGIGTARQTLEGGTKYFASLMDGLLAGAFEHGYSILLCPKLLGDAPDAGINDGRCDGLILYNVESTKTNARMLQECTQPFVLIHSPGSDFGCDVPSVRCDNREGMSLALGHLVELGHRRIAYVHDSHFGSREVADRLALFKEISHELGLDLTDDDVYPTSDFDGCLDGGYTAVIAFHDGIAGRVMARAQEVGLMVPEQLSVVGFDSTSYCRELSPQLTSVSQPLQEMGQRAVEMLMTVLRGARPEPMEIVMPCTLDVRASTGPVPPARTI